MCCMNCKLQTKLGYKYCNSCGRQVNDFCNSKNNYYCINCVNESSSNYFLKIPYRKGIYCNICGKKVVAIYSDDLYLKCTRCEFLKSCTKDRTNIMWVEKKKINEKVSFVKIDWTNFDKKK